MEPDREEVAGPPGPAAASGFIPWEDPQLSSFRGFCRTLRLLFLAPAEFFQTLAQDGGPPRLAEPFAFGLIVGTAGSLCSLFWYLLLLLAGAARVPGVFGIGVGTVLVVMAFSPFLVAANLGIGSLCLWGGMAAAGAGSGFTPAWRIYCYIQGVAVLGIIPFFGAPLAKIWGIFLIFLGARTHLEMSPWKALAALLLFLLFAVSIWMFLLGSLLALLGLLGFLLFLGGS